MLQQRFGAGERIENLSLGVGGEQSLLIVLQALTGQSIGMRLARLRVARLAAPNGPPGLLPVAIRTALLCLVLYRWNARPLLAALFIATARLLEVPPPPVTVLAGVLL